MRVLVLILLCALMPLSAFGQAQEDPGIPGSATVPDRSTDSRNAVLPTALAAALQRLSPDEDPGARIDTAAALAADETLLMRFEYVQVTRATASGIPSIRLQLQTWFRSVPARELLVRAGLPVWRGGGVAATLWLVDDRGEDGRRLLRAADIDLEGFIGRLEPRGVRLRWPMHDLEDLRMVDDLAPENLTEALSDASRRSAAEAALLAWVRHGEDGSAIDWYLGHNDPRKPLEHFTSSGADLATAMESGASRLLAVLAQRHAVQPGTVASASRDIDRGPGEYRLWLENLRRAGAYAQAVALLGAQPVVSSVTPEQADGDRVRVRIQTTAPLGELLALLAADGRLDVEPTPPGDADLSLRWRD